VTRPGDRGRVIGRTRRRLAAEPVYTLRRLVPPQLRMMSRRAAFVVVPALIVALILAPSALAGTFTPQDDSGSPNAGDIRSLYNLIAVMGLVVFLGVEGTLIYCLVRYKARKGNVAAQIHGNTRLEIGWTVGAAVILVFIIAVTFIKLPDIKNPLRSRLDPAGNQVAQGDFLLASTDQPSPPDAKTALNIKVDGQQYVWRYQYPGPKRVYAYETMVVPVGTTVTLDVSADDVMHSFWVPALGGKIREQDVVPGQSPGDLRRPVRRAVRAQPREHVRVGAGRLGRSLQAVVRPAGRGDPGRAVPGRKAAPRDRGGPRRAGRPRRRPGRRRDGRPVILTRTTSKHDAHH
jgi:cytochrome c oxidase subunit 2